MTAVVVRPIGEPHALIARLATALALSLLIAASARIQVPFWPVPMTWPVTR